MTSDLSVITGLTKQTSAVAKEASLANIVDRGARIFVAGKSSFPTLFGSRHVQACSSSPADPRSRDQGPGLQSFNAMQSGGCDWSFLLVVPCRVFGLIILSPDVPLEELRSTWTKVMQDAVRSINEKLSQDC